MLARVRRANLSSLDRIGDIQVLHADLGIHAVVGSKASSIIEFSFC